MFYCREGISINSKITVCAASSLEPVIFKISDIIKKKLGINLKLNTSSSSIIAKQIEEGIKCDIFASANIDWINYLIKKK